jgi:hypothetical protein
MIDWIKTAQRRWDRGRGFRDRGHPVEPRPAALGVLPEAPNHARIAGRSSSPTATTRLLVLDRRLVARQSARHALAGNAYDFG